MTFIPPEARLIGRVVAGVLEDRGAVGVVLVSPPSWPETTLLAGWLEGAGVEVRIPPASVVEGVARALGRDAAGEGRGPGEAWEAHLLAEAWRAAGRSLALEGFLPAHAVNRTALLLSHPSLPPEPLLPLADLPAGRILEWTGGCTLPAPFHRLDARGVARLEELLASWEVPQGKPASLPHPGDHGLETALAEEAWHRRRALRWVLGAPVVIPRIGERTPIPGLGGVLPPVASGAPVGETRSS